jgi:hypothetical protein
MYATASLYRIAPRRSASRGGSKRAERAKAIDKVSAAKIDATADIMADFVKSGTDGVPSNVELERPTADSGCALGAQNTQGAHSAPLEHSRPLQAMVRSHCLELFLSLTGLWGSTSPICSAVCKPPRSSIKETVHR